MTKVFVLLTDCNDSSKLDELLAETQKSNNDLIGQFIVCYSKTFEDYKQQPPKPKIQKDHSGIEVTRYSLNLGYGGDQKVVYKSIADVESGVVVVINGERRFSVDLINKIAQPIICGDADVVLGNSQIAKNNSSAKNVLPINRNFSRFSTFINNFLGGTKFLDWHSGYRAYSTASLNSINFVECPNGFSFDTDVLLQMNSAGFRIAEVTIDTPSGLSKLRKIRFTTALSSLMTVVRHRLKIMGFSSSNVMRASYRFKFNEYSSHSKLREVLQNISKSRILDLGCADGQLSEVAASLGHKVTAVDIEEAPKFTNRITFFQCDLENGLPNNLTGKFDVVLCADVLEHLRKPDIMLFKLLPKLSDNGMILVSIPNFGHWYPRIRTFIGRFDYDARGILDQTHLRFFTRNSFTKMATKAGYKVKRIAVTGTPFEVMLREAPQRRFSWTFLISTLSNFDRMFCKIRPTLFGYQFIFELTPLVSLTSNELSR